MKIFAVTGANSGIGKETTRELYQQGHRVVMICRNKNKAAEAKADIEDQVRSARAGQLDILLCDLARPADIVAACRTLLNDYDRLDGLVNNAGLIVPKKKFTKEDIETTFAVNHLAPFLMTHLLLDRLKATEGARVVTVSSEAHRIAKFDVTNLRDPRDFEPMLTYADSKLCNILFTKRLAQELEGSGITANCLHPGGVATNFGRGFSGFYRGLMLVARPFMISPEQGAQTSIFLTLSPDVAHITGEYFADKKVKKASNLGRSQRHADALWDLSLRLTNAEKHRQSLAEAPTA